MEELIAENKRLLARIQELSVKPLYPEEAVRAVWEHGFFTERHRGLGEIITWEDHAEEVSRIFVEALRDA